MNWQPIETAPKDGTPIIAWNGDTKYPTLAQFKDGEWRGNHYGDREPYWYYADLKYWHPLPELPKEKP